MRFKAHQQAPKSEHVLVGGHLRCQAPAQKYCPSLMAEAQKPKTFRVATFYAQKLSGRSARKCFSGQALLPLTTLPKMNVLAPPPLTESQQISPNRAKNGGSTS